MGKVGWWCWAYWREREGSRGSLGLGHRPGGGKEKDGVMALCPGHVEEKKKREGKERGVVPF
jgi:hypothetical protein